MIHEQMKNDNNQALKDKDSVKRSVLALVLSKLNVKAVMEKTPYVSDEATIQFLSKIIKELEDEKTMFEKVKRDEKVLELTRQIDIMKSYLPVQLNEEEIKEIIISLEDKTIPNVMKYFKANYAGKVDMGLVNKVVKSL